MPRRAIAASLTCTEALRRLGMCTTGGSHKTLKRYAEDVWRIPTDHFDADAARRPRGRAAVPLGEVLVVGATYSRKRLKARLFASGLKARACELCGQGEGWRPRATARPRPRPSRQQLAVAVAADGWSAVGRRYGVSDNAVRRWLRGGEHPPLVTE